MQLQDLITALQTPSAYPHPAEDVQTVQTHISVVFLAGEFAYKVKKPVDLGFLDFTTLAQRERFCRDEVRLNRRLAPGVYLGVVPIVSEAGGLRVGGSGDAVEWAVRMVRLPEERTFDALLARDELAPADLRRLAGRLAAFHREASSGPDVSRWGGWQTVAGNARENFEQIQPYIDDTVSRVVFEALERRTEADLSALRPLIEARAAADVPRDTHGDLHLKHVYRFPDAAPPADLVVVDCIEFNERFRFADPVSDMAFMAMDLRYHHRGDLADVFTEAYFAAAGDDAGRALLSFYTAYRALVRAKVDGFASRGEEIPEAQREAFRARARGYFLLALGVLLAPAERPALVLTSGLPGTGKSWLAGWLAQHGGAVLVSTDVVRKELAGLPPETDARAAPDEGIYTPDWTERTYRECLHRLQAHWFSGRRVVLDGTFGEEDRRRQFLDAADGWRVPAHILRCEAPAAVVRERLHSRTGTASDADWRTYEHLRDRWESTGGRTAAATTAIDTSGSVESTRAQALEALARAELL